MAKTFNQLCREHNDMRYIGPLITSRGGGRLPRKLPKERVVVHNHIAHTKDMPIGLNGFRCWTQKLTPELERCKCGWQGVEHYHVKGASHRSFTRAQLERRLGERLWY